MSPILPDMEPNRPRQSPHPRPTSAVRLSFAGRGRPRHGYAPEKPHSASASNYKGLAIDYRNEFSSTDADQTKASVTGGYAWGSGNVTAILSRDTSDPITNQKTGLTTLDFRPLLGPEFDFRSTTSGQPGVACEYSPVFSSQPATIRCKRGTPMYQLPADHSGLGATVALPPVSRVWRANIRRCFLLSQPP